MFSLSSFTRLFSLRRYRSHVNIRYSKKQGFGRKTVLPNIAGKYIVIKDSSGSANSLFLYLSSLRSFRSRVNAG